MPIKDRSVRRERERTADRNEFHYHKPLSESEKNSIVRLRRCGVVVEQIARDMRRSLTSVKKVIRSKSLAGPRESR